MQDGDFVALDSDGFVAIPSASHEAIRVGAQDIANMEAERNAKLFAGEWAEKAGGC